jgi:hypothetical protein
LAPGKITKGLLGTNTPAHLNEASSKKNKGFKHGDLAGKDDELGLLISIGQDLETVGDDGQEFDVVSLQQGDHLWDAAGKPDGVLGPFLVSNLLNMFSLSLT